MLHVAVVAVRQLKTPSVPLQVTYSFKKEFSCALYDNFCHHDYTQTLRFFDAVQNGRLMDGRVKSPFPFIGAHQVQTSNYTL